MKIWLFSQYWNQDFAKKERKAVSSYQCKVSSALTFYPIQFSVLQYLKLQMHLVLAVELFS